MSTFNEINDDADSQRRLRETFARRAEQLARRGRQSSALLVSTPVLVLCGGGERFAIELNHVEQVFPHAQVVPLPGAPAALMGVSNLHGSPRSIFALSRLVEMQQPDSSPRYIVLLNVSGKRIGLAVEMVEQICHLQLETLMPLQETAGAGKPDLIQGVTDDRVAVLDAHLLFQKAAQGSAAQEKKLPLSRASRADVQLQQSCPAHSPGEKTGGES
jgi:purine-binding chemotaxis protein CheW